MNALLPTCVILGLYAGCTSGFVFLRARSAQASRSPTISVWHFPLATLLLAVAIGLPTTLQFYFPGILSTLQRDGARIISGEWWRLVTTLFVQDGGVAGSIFNLITLLLVGGVAEQLWGGKWMLGIFFIGGIFGELVALSWQPIGAGNSVGNFSLAASIALTCLAQQPGRVVQIAALIALSADCMLLVLRDIHGAAATAGVLLALALRSIEQRQGPANHPPGADLANRSVP